MYCFFRPLASRLELQIHQRTQKEKRRNSRLLGTLDKLFTFGSTLYKSPAESIIIFGQVIFGGHLKTSSQSKLSNDIQVKNPSPFTLLPFIPSHFSPIKRSKERSKSKGLQTTYYKGLLHCHHSNSQVALQNFIVILLLEFVVTLYCSDLDDKVEGSSKIDV